MPDMPWEKLLINALLEVIKAQGEANGVFIPQQVPQGHAEQGRPL